MVKTINELVNKAKEIETKTLVVACAADEHVLEAVELARKEDIINGILVGEQQAIINILDKLNIDKSHYQILDIEDQTEACLEAVKLVSANDGYFLMKGLVDTSTILRAALNKDWFGDGVP